MNPMDLKRGIDKAVEAVVEGHQEALQEGHLERRDRPGRHDLANGDKRSAR
jgi:chaperonin GroEL (HSP60 family)